MKWTKLTAYRKCLAAVPLAIVMNIQCFQKVDADVTGTVNDFFIRSMFDIRSYAAGDRTVLLLSFESIAYILLIALCCGMDIYETMMSRGIYAVIRVRNKKTWLLEQVGSLAETVFWFGLLYAGTVWLLQAWHTGTLWTAGSARTLFVAVWFLWEVVFLLALLMNEAALHSTVRTGCVCGVAALLVLVTAAIFYENIPVLQRWPCMNPLWICNLYQNTKITDTAIWPVYHLLICAVCIAAFIWHNRYLEMPGLKKEE